MTEWTALRNRLMVWKAGQASGIIKLVSRGLQKNKIPFARKPLSPCSAQVFIFHAEVSPTLNTAEACRKGPCLPENSPQQGSLPCLENDWTYEKLLLKKKSCQHFSGGSVVENPPASAGDMGLIPAPGRFRHATEQLRPCATTT